MELSLWCKGQSILNPPSEIMFETALQSLPQFIQEMDADWEMVFDWMEDQCGALSEEQLNEIALVFDATLL